MTLDEAIKHCEEATEKNEIRASWFRDKEGYENCIECANEHRQLAEWLKCLAKIADMLDGTIDHLNGDDAKELLSDIKWELKLAKLTEV